MTIEYPVGFSQEELRNKPICGVLAVAIAAGVSYQVSLAALKRNMPSHRKRFTGGTYDQQQLAALSQLGVQYQVTLVDGWRFGEMVEAGKFEADTTYLITIRGHIFTYRNGIVCDQSKNMLWSETLTKKKKVLRIVKIIGKGWSQATAKVEPIKEVREVVKVAVDVEALKAFAEAVTAKRAAYFTKQGYKQATALVTLKIGSKYAKLICQDSGSVFCFVELASGDIYKAASYAAPAKHARGNIAKGADDVSPYGANYLR